MDFQKTILTAAERNNQSHGGNQIRYYSTKFEPPKKVERKKTLSANIQKFLARKEEEEKQKASVAKEKRDKLLELRSKDKKATRRVNVMLRRTKSANQAAIDDAVDKNNTSITLAGCAQPDEDDYGYVSQSAADYYNKMMEKYNSMPDEKKYDFTKKKVNGNLSSTKDRVKNALNREEEEAAQPHRRKRKQDRGDGSSQACDDPYEDKPKEEKPKLKIKAAPVINFNDLLKIAEKKQFEPIKVEPKVKEKEEERLLTKKQKREQEKDREYREQREKREKERAMGISPAKVSKQAPAERKPTPKPNEVTSRPPPSTNGIKKDSSIPPNASTKGKLVQKCDTSNKRPEASTNSSNTPLSKDLNRDPSRNKLSNIKSKDIRPKEFPPRDLKPKEFPPREVKPKEFPPRDLKSKELKSKGVPGRDAKPKEFPPRDLKPKQFPPRDLKPKQFPPPDVRSGRPQPKRKPVPGRIYDDEDEYDSEMDDFIDDGPEEEEDYSRHIREMFGYDKRKYSHLEDDDDNMESSFAQQMREEVISTKIGIMEDLEEQRKEDEHNRRKAIIKKQLQRH